MLNDLKVASFVAVLLSGLLSACERDELPVPGNASSCASRGGDWRKTCITQQYRCVTSFQDGGRACRGASECIGECVVDLTERCSAPGNCEAPSVPAIGAAAVGSCQVDNDPCGTLVIVDDGLVTEIRNRD